MNHFVNFYIDNVINAFRVYNESLFNVNIQGLGLFANKEDRTFAYLLSQLANYGFTVNLNSSNKNFIPNICHTIWNINFDE